MERSAGGHYILKIHHHQGTGVSGVQERGGRGGGGCMGCRTGDEGEGWGEVCVGGLSGVRWGGKRGDDVSGLV